MLGTIIWFRLFGENLQAFASQYFRSVPNSVISCGSVLGRYSSFISCSCVLHISKVGQAAYPFQFWSAYRDVLSANACFRAQRISTSPSGHAVLSHSHTKAQDQQSSLQRFSNTVEIHHKKQLYGRFCICRCRNRANRKVKNQLYGRFLVYRCRNRANRKVDWNYNKKQFDYFYIFS